MPVTTLNTILNRRDGAFHRYWKVGTTEGSDGGSHWTEMREGGFVSIGWSEQVPDLSETIGQEKTTAKIKSGIFFFRFILQTLASHPERLAKY